MVRRIIRYLLAGLTGIILLLFVFRSPMVSWYVHRKVAAFNNAHPARLTVGKVQMQGLASLMVTGISLKPDEGDTLLKIDSAYASIGIVKLLAGRISLHDVRLVNTRLLIERSDSIANYRFLLRRDKKESDTAETVSSYASAVDRITSLLFDKIPLSMDVRNLDVISVTDGHRVGMHIAKMALSDHRFQTGIEVSEDSLTMHWNVEGQIDNPEHRIAFRLWAADSGRIRIPWIGYRWQATVGFDTLAAGITSGGEQGGIAQVNGFAMLRGLTVDHRRIAARPVTFDKLSVDYRVNIGSGYAELDSSSCITFNRINLNPYIKVQLRPAKQITIHAVKPPFPAQDLFSSFPEGLFTNLDGMRTKGELSWYFDFFVDLSVPDSLRFETSLDRHKFAVTSYGKANLTRIDSAFEYTAYDRDIPVRTFIVGPANPSFRSLDRISPFLQYAVLTSEDGAFFQHRGFLPDAFRESIAQNIRERRFARGGSTISMQLVKNVFLSRNKTVARKLEEALIVWLIENQGLCTKERMFEVYLNIIEWGPGIYGACEASHYYFAKEPSKLTLAEAIYLASIIPRPKWFKYSFDETGHLKASNADYYRLVSEKMLGKGWITPSDADNLLPDVALKGPAKLMLLKRDTLTADTVFYPEWD